MRCGPRLRAPLAGARRSAPPVQVLYSFMAGDSVERCSYQGVQNAPFGAPAASTHLSARARWYFFGRVAAWGVTALVGCGPSNQDSNDDDTASEHGELAFPDGTQACFWLFAVGNLFADSVFVLSLELPSADYEADAAVSYSRALSGSELTIWVADGGVDAEAIGDCNHYVLGATGTRIEADGVEFAMTAEPAGTRENPCVDDETETTDHVYDARVTLSPFAWGDVEYTFPVIEQLVGDSAC